MNRADQKKAERLYQTANELVDVCTSIRDAIFESVRAVVLAQPDGLPTGHDTNRSNDVSDPTLNAVLAGENGRRRLDHFHIDLRVLVRSAERAHDTTLDLRRISQPSPHRPAVGSGECCIDDEYVPGMGEDRIKSGMCPRHYTRFLRWREETHGTRDAFILVARAEEQNAKNGKEPAP